MKDCKTDSSATPVVNDWGSRRYIQTLVLLVVIAIGIYLCFRLALPFLAAFTWALALAVMVIPVQRWLESKVKSPGLAAVLSVTAIALAVLGLAVFVGQRLVREAARSSELIKTKVESGEWRHAIEGHPRLIPLADWIERQNLPAAVEKFSAGMTAAGAAFVKGSVVEVMGLLLTFYLLFFLLRDRGVAIQSLQSLSPLSVAELDRLCGRVGDTIYATMSGTLVVAATQGLLGGVMFWWLGLPAPLLWGVVMALLAVVPVLGAFVIWIPAALWLAIEGNWGQALVLAVWGGAVIGVIDNLLRPILVGKLLKHHTALAFISIVGGLIVFGSEGLILGPVILTVTVELLNIWHCRTAGEPGASAGQETDRVARVRQSVLIAAEVRPARSDDERARAPRRGGLTIGNK